MQPSPAILTINSAPPGAEARLSTGGACQTPCTLSVSAADDFTVTYALDGYVSRTIPVRFVPAVRSALIEVTAPSLDPNPVVVTLEPAPASPPPKAPPVSNASNHLRSPRRRHWYLGRASETEIGQTLLFRPTADRLPSRVRGTIYLSGEYRLDGSSLCRVRSRSHLNCQELKRPAHQGPARQGVPTNYPGRTTEPAAGLRRPEGSRLLQCWYTRNCRQQVIEWRRRRTMQMQPQDRSKRITPLTRQQGHSRVSVFEGWYHT
jgi:hypothetical protein